MGSLLQKIMDGSYMPHGHCLLWQKDLLFMHVGSDIVIALSYFSIPTVLIILAKRRQDLNFNHLFWLFSLFIVACGTSHLVDVVNVWHGYYYSEGLVKVFTALVSATTAVMMWVILPKIMQIPSMAEMNNATQALRNEVLLREKAELSLRKMNQQQEKIIAERTAELKSVNDDLSRKVAQLEEKQSQLQAIMDFTPSLIFIKDTEGRMVTANRAFLDTYGFSIEHIIGKTNDQLFPIELAENFNKSDREALGQKATISALATLQVKGEARQYSAEKFPIFSQSGQVLGIAGIVRDMTDIIKSDNKEALLTSIIETSGDAIIVKSLDSKIISWNPSAERIFGYSATEMTGHSVEIIIPEDRRHEENYIIEQISQGKLVPPFDTQRVDKAGNVLDVSIVISPITDNKGKVVAASTIIRDISRNKSVERQLREKTKQLTDSNQQLNEFIHIASHDMRAPLRGIRNYANFLDEDCKSLMPIECQQHLNGIQDLTERLDKLLSDLLHYSQLDPKNIELQATPLLPLLEEVRERFVGLEGFTITLPQTEAVVYCDKLSLPEVFANLIDNAYKYNKSDDKRLDIEVQQTKDQWEIRFRDNGIGIDPKYREDIFQCFFRLNGKQEYGGGSGAGLAISRKIVQQHHGDIYLAQSEDEGSCFVIRLPTEKQ